MDILAGEMRHRAKNLIPLIEGIGRLSRPKNKPDVDEYIDAFLGRLTALLRAGDVILSTTNRTADLRTVLDMTLAPFQDELSPERFVLSGPPVALSERSAGSLALAIHELATNAIKYGALSTQSGSVSLTWDLTPGVRKRFTMDWKEKGGPRVTPPAAEGFGGRVIRHSVAHEPNGHIALDYSPEGLHCRFEFDMAM